MATILNTSGLTEYVEQNREQLFVDSIADFKTLDYVELMLGVKGKEALHYLESEVELIKAQCGWNPGGSDTFIERFIETSGIEINKSWCHFDFEGTYAQWQLAYEAGRETLPFEEKFAESNVAAISKAMEELAWQGNSALTVTGFINDIKAVSGDTVEFNSGQTVTEKIDAVVEKLTSRMLRKGVNIFVSPSDFNKYVREQNGTCCANRPVLDAASEELAYFGDSRIKIVPIEGIEGLGVIVAATPDALVAGMDIKDSHATYRLWYSEDNDEFRFRMLTNFGTAVKWPDEVVMGSQGE